MSYTASDAFLEALWEAGVEYCFVNLGSDHPAIMESFAKSKSKLNSVKVITCPTEMVALSMADGYARRSGKPQVVIVHVDVGTQALGCAVHNAHIARSPVLIFAGLTPATIEGELRGSRTEFVNFLQDVPDQSAIVRQYCRYANEIRSSANVKQMISRALQVAQSDPKGPAYLYAAREVLEQEITPYRLDQRVWKPVGASALPQSAVQEVMEAMVSARKPLIVTGYAGRNNRVPALLVELADLVPAVEVLDMSISDVCFPANHPAWLGGMYSAHPSIESADFILILDCDTPWVPTKCRPKEGALIYQVDIDPLKKTMPVYYVDAVGRWQVDAYTAIEQFNQYLSTHPSHALTLGDRRESASAAARLKSYEHRLQFLKIAGTPQTPTAPLDASIIANALKRHCPESTLWCVEAVTNTMKIYNQLQCTTPGSYISSGATGLGWGGGGSLGVKLAALGEEEPKFVTQIIGDGTYMFSMPSSVYWVSQRYAIPILTIVLSNGGWNAPRVSLELVHPTGVGSRASNADLNISLANPTPDFGGIARAASGNQIYTALVRNAAELETVLPKAIRHVQDGVTAVVECTLTGLEGRTG